jgi:hypothetical protein
LDSVLDMPVSSSAPEKEVPVFDGQGRALGLALFRAIFDLVAP